MTRRPIDPPEIPAWRRRPSPSAEDETPTLTSLPGADVFDNEETQWEAVPPTDSVADKWGMPSIPDDSTEAPRAIDRLAPQPLGEPPEDPRELARRLAAEAKAKKDAEAKKAADQTAKKEADAKAAKDRQTAAELEAMGVPLSQRRAAGTAKAAAAEDLVVSGDQPDEDSDRTSTTPGTPAADVGVDVPPAQDEGAGWQRVVDELSAEIDAASGKKNAETRATLQYEIGRVLAYRMGDWPGAAPRFESALKEQADHIPSLRELVRYAVSRKEWDTAVELLGRRAEATKDSVGKTAALLASAHIQLTEQKDKQESAAKVLEQALDVHPENYTALRFLRVIHYDKEQYSKLIDVLGKARELAGAGEKLRLDYEIGRVHDEVLQDRKSALEAFRRALAEDGRLIPAFLYSEQLLTADNDKAGLVSLWRDAADAWAKPDVSWWLSRAARLGEIAGVDADTVAGDWKRAVDEAEVPQFLAEEYRHWLEARNRLDDLSAAAEAALDRVEDPRERAGLCATLGNIALRGGDHDGATSWFDKALEADPACVTAREGRRRVPVSSGAWEPLLAEYAAANESASSTRVKLAMRLKQAEIALDRMDDPAAARTHLEAAVELAPNYLPAVDSLVLVLQAQGDHAGCAERLEQASALVDSDSARSTYLMRSARAYHAAGEPAKAAELLEKSAEHVPGMLLTREWQGEALIAAGKWAEAAAALKTAASETEDAALQVSLLYRSARLSMARAGDVATARDTYSRLLELVPDFLPATIDLRDLSAADEDYEALGAHLENEATAERDEAAAAWWNIYAGQTYERAGRTESALERYRAALESSPGHPVAHACLRRVFRGIGDWSALAKDIRDQLAAAEDPARQDALRLQLVSTLEQLGEPAAVASEVGALLGSERASSLPVTALGILCEGLQIWEKAVAAYDAAGSNEDLDAGLRAACRFQQGLLKEEGFEDQDAAAALYKEADALAGHHPMALENLETIFGAKGDRAGLAEVYGRQAANAGSAPVQTFYALLAGDEQERLGAFDAAKEAYQTAFSDPVGQERAYDALRRICLKAGDVGALRSVTAEMAGDGASSSALARWMELGDGLLSIGESASAIEAYDEVVKRDGAYLAAWYHLEHLQGEVESWNDVLGALEAIGEGARSKKVKDAVAARTETLLEEKGVTSDSASDFYTKRLASEPTNVVALRGLGGIALSRGDNKEAKKHYTALAKCAKDPAHLAEAESQLGAIALGEGKGDAAAIKHFEKALEHVPAWRAATDGLRGIHERTENWKALVGVVARESTANPERRVELHAEIARLWQDRIGEPKIAIASWNKVLQEEPGHDEARERLLGLYEDAGEWAKYLDIADGGLAGLEGDARRDRSAELGIVAHERAGQTDRALAYLNDAIATEVPSIPALETLRRIHEARGDAEQVVGLTVRQAEHTEDAPSKVALYVSAAQVRADQLLDRDGAAELFGKALAADGDCVPALAFFVNWHYDAEAWDEASKVFAAYQPTVEGRDLDDDDERMDATAFYFKYGTVLVKTGDEAGEAIDKFGRALELTPTHLPSLEAAAPRYVAAERWAEARDACRTILRLRGGMGDSEAMTELYLNLGKAETELGDTKNSLKRFKKALDLSQNNVDALLGIAGVHRATGEWNSLLSTYNSIIKYARDPDQVIRAYLTKGDVLERKLSIVDKAVLHYEKVLMYDKNNVSAMTRLGQIALKRGDTKAAGDYADRAVSAARDDDEKRLGLLLSGLIKAGGDVNVKKVVKGVSDEVGDGALLEKFSLAAGDGSISRDKAAEAYAAATTSV
mgnify:FL=1